MNLKLSHLLSVSVLLFIHSRLFLFMAVIYFFIHVVLMSLDSFVQFLFLYLPKRLAVAHEENVQSAAILKYNYFIPLT